MTAVHLRALELTQDGQWDEAHRLVQSGSDRFSCLIHGYLHRVEGDLWNARYWYDRAGEAMPDNSLQAEWQRLCDLLVGPSAPRGAG